VPGGSLALRITRSCTFQPNISRSRLSQAMTITANSLDDQIYLTVIITRPSINEINFQGSPRRDRVKFFECDRWKQRSNVIADFIIFPANNAMYNITRI
jgi:hypothetical protein